MKLLKKATLAIVFAFIYAFSFQCVAQEGKFRPVFEEQLPFKVKPAAFQEWYAGIKVGGTGINIFIPITDLDENIKIDRIYFRNLTSELSKKDDKYFAVLENKSRDYTFKKPEADKDYPFKLKDSECVVSYIENGTTKYLKIGTVNEFAGVYYENGHPSIYTNESATAIATVDDDDE
ncbi:hypothetical protein KO504_10030 [Winogradskyella psychrotolerans]|uniref:hypothetical protein n=1 Tax=Winogradskyella psychrotolerans TaxID=1344585 RepID=UPI001C07A7B4|nr:hypothetical protein [Winogradskyella psychrotolerans]MBU2921679.1 hypothetical protein [Winogradskyella psychrotolerans]|eukprot:TRINITY_DN11810_c0_g1_i1.p2 TRINITY_DN11810_c0_g1~~TRINITY_DN11810_c0_g1_i1.p2  ORF type:complete len:177 (-),score=33.34 TRINITY_DN11810_c0_g1_i1:1364-1894(-)